MNVRVTPLRCDRGLEFASHKHLFEFLAGDVHLKLATIGRCDTAGFLTYYDGQGVGLVACSFGSTVSQSELLRNVQVVRGWHDT